MSRRHHRPVGPTGCWERRGGFSGRTVAEHGLGCLVDSTGPYISYRVTNCRFGSLGTLGAVQDLIAAGAD